MDIAITYNRPLPEGAVRILIEKAGLQKEPPLECFSGQLFSQQGRGGRIRVAVTKKRDRIVISTHYINAHMRSFQLLELAEAAVPLGKSPELEFSQEFSHMDLAAWFPGGQRENNHIRFSGEN